VRGFLRLDPRLRRGTPLKAPAVAAAREDTNGAGGAAEQGLALSSSTSCVPGAHGDGIAVTRR
jgi:hypothetical protein